MEARKVQAVERVQLGQEACPEYDRGSEGGFPSTSSGSGEAVPGIAPRPFLFESEQHIADDKLDFHSSRNSGADSRDDDCQTCKVLQQAASV